MIEPQEPPKGKESDEYSRLEVSEPVIAVARHKETPEGLVNHPDGTIHTFAEFPPVYLLINRWREAFPGVENEAESREVTGGVDFFKF